VFELPHDQPMGANHGAASDVGTSGKTVATVVCSTAFRRKTAQYTPKIPPEGGTMNSGSCLCSVDLEIFFAEVCGEEIVLNRDQTRQNLMQHLSWRAIRIDFVNQ
jgi:hypothetical protein